VVEEQGARRAVGSKPRTQSFGELARPLKPSLAIADRSAISPKPQHRVEVSPRPVTIRRPCPALCLGFVEMWNALVARPRRLFDPGTDAIDRIIPREMVHRWLSRLSLARMI